MNDEPHLKFESPDVMIDACTQQTSEYRRDLWLSPAYTAHYPEMVERLLSAEGLAAYPSDTRATIYLSALDALGTYPLNRKPERRIPSAYYSYNITSGEIGPIGGTKYKYPDEVTSLLEIDIAGTLALGMSLPEYEAAMGAFLDTYAHTPNKQSLKPILGRLLMTHSTGRKWVKQHELDTAGGHEWDQTLATLTVSLPEYVIKPEKNQPKALPRDLVFPSAHEFYSAAAMDIFLAYAAFYAEQVKLTASTDKELQEFSVSVRKMPNGFMKDNERQYNLLTILAATSNPQVQDNSGNMVSAREYLQKHAPHRSRERFVGWYNRGVKELEK